MVDGRLMLPCGLLPWHADAADAAALFQHIGTDSYSTMLLPPHAAAHQVGDALAWDDRPNCCGNSS